MRRHGYTELNCLDKKNAEKVIDNLPHIFPSKRNKCPQSAKRMQDRKISIVIGYAADGSASRPYLEAGCRAQRQECSLRTIQIGAD